jgi:enoyl-CoA hydratase
MSARLESAALIEVHYQPLAGGVVARLTICRPQRANALNRAVMQAFTSTLATLAGRDDLRALVVATAGTRAFISGADIDEMAGITNAGQARAFITQVRDCCDAVRNLPVPVIARIHGATFGAGLELAVSCDLRVAAADARFGMPEVRLGIPSVVQAALLPGLIGWGRTRELLLTGTSFGAADALAWGLVERVAPAGELDQCIDQWLAGIASCGPAAVRLQKRLIRRWEDLPLGQAVAAGIDSFAAAWGSEEPARMLRAARARPAPLSKEPVR